MERQRASNLFAALVAAWLLLLTAWGNAFALLVAPAAALVVGWVFFRPRDGRATALTILTGGVVAALVVVVLRRLH